MKDILLGMLVGLVVIVLVFVSYDQHHENRFCYSCDRSVQTAIDNSKLHDQFYFRDEDGSPLIIIEKVPDGWMYTDLTEEPQGE